MAMGFFDLGTGDTLESIRSKKANKLSGCDACGLFRDCQSPKLGAIGKGRLKILIIGDTPGKSEDEEGTPGIGQSATMIQRELERHDIDILKDCVFINASGCYPKKGEKTSELTITECRGRILAEIEKLKPILIIPMGETAVNSVLGHRLNGRLSRTSYSSFFSEQIPDQEYKAWVCPTYHPRQIIKNEKDLVLKSIWKRDLKSALELVKNNISVPVYDFAKECHITQDRAKVFEILQHILDHETLLAYDYETTGLKPHRDAQKIVSVSVAFNNEAWGFPFYNDPEFLELWKEVLTSPRIFKIAHKLDFENGWTYFKAAPPSGSYYPEPYAWDTCLGAHCINNTKPTSLKFWGYIKFGIIGYDDKVDKFITGCKPGEDEKSSNHLNRIHECSMLDILPYNAEDSLISLYLYSIQRRLLNADQRRGLHFFIDGANALSKVQGEGMRLNMEQLKLQQTRLDKRISKLEQSLREFEEVKTWEQRNRGKTFNPGSNTQISNIVYDILGFPKPETGPKTDDEALSKINTPFVEAILSARKFKKMRDTYLAQYAREEVNGLVRPFFNLHLVSTFRSSSDSPNFQNIPKRDPQAKAIIRSTIVPSKGNRLKEYDYKGIEVAVSCCYHKDPNMLKYIIDPTTDMHRDTAMELFFKTKETFTKDERQAAKNGFVFPAFYGSNFIQIAPNIWDMIDDNTKASLEKHGVKSLGKIERDGMGKIIRSTGFYSHVRDIENKFWNDRFPVYKEWKYKVFKEYEQKGYIDTYTGFRCYGPMKFTEVTNYPIQGSAFHCLLWTLIQVQPKIKEISGKSSIIGQIHDAMVGDIHPDDETECDRLIDLWGCKKIREEWPWLVVPFKIEKERSEVDGDWSEMKEQKE